MAKYDHGTVVHKRKSQAAMEFLLTYGWAVMVVLVVIAALAYFGVLDATRFAPTKCVLPPELSCLDHTVTVYNVFGTNYNRLEINLKNNIGNPIQLSAIDITKFNNKHVDLLYIPILNNGDKTQSPNNIIVTSLTNGLPYMPSGTKYDFDFTITYTNQESQLPHTVMGHVNGKVI